MASPRINQQPIDSESGIVTTIRPEEARDEGEIRSILIDAFANHPFSRQTEHLIVDQLRLAGALSLGLVALDEGEVAGYIAFSEAKIDGRSCDWYLLGPVAVRPSLQKQGIGQALIREGLSRIRQRGAQGCFLVGDPGYYTRLGFRQIPGLFCADVPPEVCLAFVFSDTTPQGEVSHHAAFSAGL